MQCGSPHFVWWTKTKAISNFSKITEDLIKVLFKKKVYKKLSLEIKLGHTILEHKRKLGNKKSSLNRANGIHLLNTNRLQERFFKQFAFILMAQVFRFLLNDRNILNYS